MCIRRGGGKNMSVLLAPKNVRQFGKKIQKLSLIGEPAGVGGYLVSLSSCKSQPNPTGGSKDIPVSIV